MATHSPTPPPPLGSHTDPPPPTTTPRPQYEPRVSGRSIVAWRTHKRQDPNVTERTSERDQKDVSDQ